MADQIANRGRLIAVDGSRGRGVDRHADRLVAELQRRGVECAVSRWDASGLFGDLAADSEPPCISARTLALLFAADLAFRLRWEIRPVLQSGGVVIAAPYIGTAIAFGSALGLPERWLRELLRFADTPSARGLIRERKIARGWKPRLDRGYPEFAAAHLQKDASISLKKARRRMIDTLENARGRSVFNLSDKGASALVTAVMNNPPAAPSRSASKLRTARK